MQITDSVSLANYSTMRLGGIAAHLAEIRNRDDLLEAVVWAEEHGQDVIMIGGGSNIYWRDEGFDGLVLVNRISGYEDMIQIDGTHLLTVGAGENWDSVVARSVAADLTGIEALSLIPGTSGGTPVQNVGAYGQRISRSLVELEAYDTKLKDFVTIAGKDCAFGYRTSRFKTIDKDRFFITSLTLRLREGNLEPPFYEALERYFDEHDIRDFTPLSVREAVIAIRRTKLPDPDEVANNGSFFANPVVTSELASELQAKFPNMPCWPGDDNTYKIPAAWLIEHVGLKDYHDPETGMATWKNHSLVLVNEHAHSAGDLLKFKAKIVDAVHDVYGIKLEQEPELLPL